MKNIRDIAVVFRKWNDGQIIALFPYEPWSHNNYMTTSYMHIGQHGSADYTGVISQTTLANKYEYKELLSELRLIGYNDLHILKKAKPKFNYSKV